MPVMIRVGMSEMAIRYARGIATMIITSHCVFFGFTLLP